MQVSDAYAQVMEKDGWSHAHGRNVAHISQADVDAARLFGYGYRAQTIGAFNATRRAVARLADEETDPAVEAWLDRASTLLEQLEAKAIDPILPDHRALISTLHSYDYWASLVDELLTNACARKANRKLETTRQLFLESMHQITTGTGLYVARDLKLPEQGAFIVPDLDIAIAPIIYGDHHSWNAAFLAGDRPGVAVHRHREGAEIHLGYGPVKGQTILGSSFSDVHEGYAMPIPPMTGHGFLNTSGHDHIVPFVFGSLKMGGWGVFFDVEPLPVEDSPRTEAPLASPEMNQSIFLDRAIEESTTGSGSLRRVLIPASHAGFCEIGGLELAITRLDQDILAPPAPHYRIVSIQYGQAKIHISGAESEVGPHDHFGIPAGMSCRFAPQGQRPLIFLDSMILPVESDSLQTGDRFPF